ncbi:MAG: phosphopantetheine-binding protein, partial [Myxococcota bacterium]
ATINWDRWRGCGDAVTRYEAWYLSQTGQPIGGGMAVSDALAATDIIVSRRFGPQVIVSSDDFAALLKEASRYQTAEVEHSELASRSASSGTAHPRPDVHIPYQPLETECERAVAAVWSDALGLQRVGREDTLSALGGDSLVAVQIASRLRKLMEVDVSVKMIYQYPSVRELAACIDDQRWLLGASGPARVGQQIRERADADMATDGAFDGDDEHEEGDDEHEEGVI